MTEPIIIDGVNVVGCNFCTEDSDFDKCYYCDELVHDDCSPIFECKDRFDCYFKQLQRLKQENEELKKELDFKEKQSNDFMIKSGEMVEKLNNLMTKYKQALENIKQFLIYADHSNTGSKYFENVEKALNIAKEVLND